MKSIKKYVYPLLISLALSIGLNCSVPDDPAWDELQDGIEHLTPSQRLAANKWSANRDAAEWFADKNKDDVVFRAVCADNEGNAPPGTKTVGQSYKITVADVLRCLEMGAGADSGNLSFEECAQKLLQDATKRFLDEFGYQGQCFRVPLGEYTEEKMPKWNPKQESERRIAEHLVAAPKIPAWVPIVIIGGVAVVLFAPAFLPALCTLQAGSGPACPSNPSYPPGDTPQPPSN